MDKDSKTSLGLMIFLSRQLNEFPILNVTSSNSKFLPPTSQPLQEFHQNDTQQNKENKSKPDMLERNNFLPSDPPNSHNNIPIKASPQSDNKYEFLKTSPQSNVQMEGRDKGHVTFKCLICAKTFSTSKALCQHRLMHLPTSFKCQKCGKSFKHMVALRTHRYRHMSWQQLQNTKDYHGICYFCPHHPIFLGRVNYENHTNWHLGEKNYKCQHCSKRFGSQASLMKHKVIHSQVNAYSCSICNLKFAFKSALEAHNSLVHKKEKPFKCSKCHGKFTTNSNLNRHNKQKHQF